MSKEDMPEEIWVYNRDGKLEAREESMIVGNVMYTRSDLLEDHKAAIRELRSNIDVIELNMAVHGGKDTQEARKIKHCAAKKLLSLIKSTAQLVEE